MTARLAAVAALAVLALAGCTSHVTRCDGDSCTVDLSGAQTVEIELGGVERDLRVDPAGDAVTVAVRGESARLAAGESAPVGGLLVRVDAVAGQDVELAVTRA